MPSIGFDSPHLIYVSVLVLSFFHSLLYLLSAYFSFRKIISTESRQDHHSSEEKENRNLYRRRRKYTLCCESATYQLQVPRKLLMKNHHLSQIAPQSSFICDNVVKAQTFLFAKMQCVGSEKWYILIFILPCQLEINRVMRHNGFRFEEWEH